MTLPRTLWYVVVCYYLLSNADLLHHESAVYLPNVTCLAQTRDGGSERSQLVWQLGNVGRFGIPKHPVDVSHYLRPPCLQIHIQSLPTNEISLALFSSSQVHTLPNHTRVAGLDLSGCQPQVCMPFHPHTFSRHSRFIILSAVDS